MRLNLYAERFVWMVLCVLVGACVSDSPSPTSKLCAQNIPDGFVCIKGRVHNARIQDRLGIPIAVIGQPTSQVQTDGDGKFGLVVDKRCSALAKAGSMTRIRSNLESERGCTVVAHDQKNKAGRVVLVDAQTLGSGKEVDVGTVELLPDGIVTGHVTLSGRGNHTGIHVYIPGTSFAATTNPNGDFKMTGVPPGTFPLVRAEKDGYDPVQVADVEVLSGQSIALEPMVLEVNTRSDGSFEFADVIRDGQGAYSTSAEVDLAIVSDDDVVVMMIAETANFEGARWQPTQASLKYTFPGSGEYTLHMKFANANGLESATVRRSITIDTHPAVAVLSPRGATSSSRPTVTWSATRVPNATYHVQLAAEGSFEAPLLEVRGVTGTSLDVLTTLAEGHRYAIRVAIENGLQQWRWSEVATFTLELGAVTLIAPSERTESSRPELDWTDSALPGVTYHVQVATDVGFTSIFEDITGLTVSSHELTTLLTQGGTYYFRVAVVDRNGVQGGFAGPSSFVVDIGSVTLDSPGENALTNDTTPEFVWNTNANAVTYTLRYGTSPALSGATVLTGITATAYTLTTSLPRTPGTYYYWQVIPVDRHGVSGAPSAIRAFTLDTEAPTGSVVLNGNDESTYNEVVSATLSASDEHGPIEVYVSRNGSFTDGSWETMTSPRTMNYSELATTNRATIKLFVRYRDAAGNETSAELSDTIALARTLVGTSTLSANGKWTLANSPYYVTGTYVVLDPATLTIEPGASVYFKEGARLEIRSGGDAGETGLAAVGTALSPISMVGARIDLNYANDWLPERAPTYGSGGTYVKGPRLEYVNMADGIIHVKIVTFDGPGFYMKNSVLGTLESDFFGYVAGTYIEHCTISNVGSSSTSLALENTQVLNSYITNMYVEGYTGPTTIQHNEIQYLEIDRWQPVASDLSYNKLHRLHWTRPSTTKSAKLRNNNFIDGAQCVLTLDADTGGNEASVDAKGNYWGPTVTEQMRSGQPNISAIHDFYDDTNLVVVDYSGFLTSPVPSAGPNW